MPTKKGKIGICTDVGENYGSLLQAFATKEILNELGYEGDIIKLSGSLIPGRDVRLKKVMIMVARMLYYRGLGVETNNKITLEKFDFSKDSLRKINDFRDSKLKLSFLGEYKLKKLAASDAYTAFLCGSDQIWITTSYYVDPFYYLGFAPEEKRIAFAASFGRTYVPAYNQKKIARYISAIPSLSVREDSGVDLVKHLTGKNAELLLDPTLVLNGERWSNVLKLKPKVINKQYVLAYFLNEPSSLAVKILSDLRKQGYYIVSLPYEREGEWFDIVASAGPREFLEWILGASFICTDSFHGTAFSVNFKKRFYVFEREYGTAAKQSTRILSLLNQLHLLDRYQPNFASEDKPDFTYSNIFLQQERLHSFEYLSKAIKKLDGLYE